MSKAPNEPTTEVALNEWERIKLGQLAGGAAFAYTSRYSSDGLPVGEMQDMNRWRSLAAKLLDQPHPEPLNYRGTRANGFRADLF